MRVRAGPMLFWAPDQRGLFRVSEHAFERGDRQRRAIVENGFVALDPEERPRAVESFGPGLLVRAIVRNDDMASDGGRELPADDFDILPLPLEAFERKAV